MKFKSEGDDVWTKLILGGILSEGSWLKFVYCFVRSVLLLLSITTVFILPPCIEKAFAEISLSWSTPTENTDKTPLTDLKGYRIYYCSGSSCYPSKLLVDLGDVTAYSFSMIKGGYRFAVTAYNSDYHESSFSNIVYKTETVYDITPPTITAFSIPASSSSLSVPVTAFVATDNVGVSDYLVSESATTPSAASEDWQARPPIYYMFTSTGVKTLYAWVRDAAGNVSASLSASVNIVTTTTDTMTPTNDTFINLDDTINSSSETLHTYTWPYEKVANSILMKFDLSGIPSGAVIQSATLNLYLLGSDSNMSYSTYDLNIHRIINHNPEISRATGYTYDGYDSWEPNTNCYNNIPMAQADISDAYVSKAVDKTLGFKSFNVTQLIADWIASPSTNYGLLINSDVTKPADTYRIFASSKNSNAAYHPYLSVAYTVGSETCIDANFKIGTGALFYYPSIQSAYDGLDNGDTLEILAREFSGDIFLNQDKSVTLAGGYRCGFLSNTGYTVVDGSLNISDGCVTIENLIIK